MVLLHNSNFVWSCQLFLRNWGLRDCTSSECDILPYLPFVRGSSSQNLSWESCFPKVYRRHLYLSL